MTHQRAGALHGGGGPDRREPGRRGAAGRGRAGRRLGFDETATGQAACSRPRRPPTWSSTPAAASCSSGRCDLARAASRSSRSTAARASPTSARACRTATPPRARPATGWARCGGCPRPSTSTPPGRGHGRRCRVWADAAARHGRAGGGQPAPSGRDGVRRRLGRSSSARAAAAIVVADGLGHGPQAREAALRALEGAARGAGVAGARRWRRATPRSRSTRGAARRGGRGRPAAARDPLSPASATSPARSWSRARRRAWSRINGTAGHRPARASARSRTPGAHGAVLVMPSDGLAHAAGRWTTTPGCSRATRPWSPASSTATTRRGRDDVTVVAVRLEAPVSLRPADACRVELASRDVVLARQRARQIARLLGFDAAGPGAHRHRRLRDRPQRRPATPAAAASSSRSTTTRAPGAGRAACATRARASPTVADVAARPLPLADRHGPRPRRRAPPDGPPSTSSPPRARAPRSSLGKHLPATTRPLDGRGGRASCRRRSPASARATWPTELQQQNQELLRALDELRGRHDDLERLNRELEDTNRGVVALYAELDEKAEHLRRADEMKSRFLSNMSHEFRTPLNSILALSRLLQDRADGDLTTRAGEAGRLHPQGRPGPDRAGQRPARPGQGGGRQDRGPPGVVRAGGRCSAPCAACCGRCWSTDAVRLVFEEPRGVPDALHATRARSRRSCATSSPTR